MLKNKPTCIITGGHFTPGLAVAKVLDSRGWELVWIGTENAFSNGKVKSLEAKILPKTNIKFYPVDTFKLDRNNFFISIFYFWRIFIGIYQAFKILNLSKPKVIFSLGSFVSFPVCFAGWILGIPIVIHEQTTASGLANRLISELADKVAISFPGTKKDFSALKIQYTGNPVRKEIFEIAKNNHNPKHALTIYITGGSRGSSTINRVVSESLNYLLERFNVVHQTGDKFVPQSNIFKSIKSNLKGKYSYSGTFTPKEVENIYKKTDIIISRSGANTVSEIAILGLPSILIPLPNTSGNEQFKNALLLQEKGLARVIVQDSLTRETLINTLEEIVKNYSSIRKNGFKTRALIPEDAPIKIANLLKSVT